MSGEGKRLPVVAGWKDRALKAEAEVERLRGAATEYRGAVHEYVRAALAGHASTPRLRDRMNQADRKLDTA